MNGDKPLTDEDLAELVKSGDESAFTKLIERYRTLAFSLAYNMTGNIAEGEDISQEAFTILYTKVGAFRGESSFKTWFYRVVINLCRRHYRRSRIVRFTSLSFLTKEGEEREMDIKVESTPENEASVNQAGASIDSAVKKPSIKQREVFILKHMKGLKISEIADVLGCSDGTVKTHLFRAVRALQQELKGVYDEMQ
ncbi:MAG: RNA polymerase sigma factor [Deltaproteobacteria bacterium]|nr:RNA polymerase sigma factor [Deltaproteobacteria bacterium]